ncbi:hypothetical protein Ddc_21994 [Ditylenchus destructor]|nr:hypothetical protein Ddc_21994 [Ditylenchus destructor]
MWTIWIWPGFSWVFVHGKRSNRKHPFGVGSWFQICSFQPHTMYMDVFSTNAKNGKRLAESAYLAPFAQWQLKNIRSIALDFGRIDANVYLKMCQVVEIDERDSQHGEFLEETHPMVELQCNSKLARA